MQSGGLPQLFPGLRDSKTEYYLCCHPGDQPSRDLPAAGTDQRLHDPAHRCRLYSAADNQTQLAMRFAEALTRSLMNL